MCRQLKLPHSGQPCQENHPGTALTKQYKYERYLEIYDLKFVREQ